MNQKNKTQSIEKENKEIFSITLSPTLVKRLDTKRGLVPRSRAIQFILSEFLIKKEKGMGNPFSNGPQLPTKKGVDTIE